MGAVESAVQLERQLAEDREALAKIVAGLEHVDELVRAADATIGAAPRGDFTPDEDDRVRQILCSYRGLRLACYEIVHRWWDFADIEDAGRAVEAFLVGYATALALYARSLVLIQSFERNALVRRRGSLATAPAGPRPRRAGPSPWLHRALTLA